VFELPVPGSSSSIKTLTASLPWQSTCGVGKEEDEDETKIVFGIVALRGEDFPLVTQRLVLPQISKVDFQVLISSTFYEQFLCTLEFFQLFFNYSVSL